MTHSEALTHLGHDVVHPRRLRRGGGCQRGVLPIELHHELAPLLAHPPHVPRQHLPILVNLLWLYQGLLRSVGLHLQVYEELPLRICRAAAASLN